MAEEKKGLFRRFFGGGAPKPVEPEVVAETVVAPQPAPEPVAPAAPEPVVSPEAVVAAEPATPEVIEPIAVEPPAPVIVEPVEAIEVVEAIAPVEFEAEVAPEPIPLVIEPEPAPVEAPVAPRKTGFFAAPEAPAPAPEPAPKQNWFQRLRAGLSRSSSALSDGIVSVFTKRKLDNETLDDFEDVLIQADLGLTTAAAITAALKKGRFDKEIDGDEVRTVLAEEVRKVLIPVAKPLVIDPARKPHVILVVGVNGTGKTTTIGKLSAKLRAEGRSVMLAAGDTFRAAAVEQLKIWAQRTGSTIVARAIGADASGLAFDALKDAQAAGTDVLLIDTAGRLQNRTELMAELEKIIRVIKKQDPTAPHSVLLTLDATTGQNALQQVEIFGRVAGVTGLVMTKLDGTARGGILVAIAAKFGLPIHFIGVGEGVDDLEPFSADEFAKAIAGIAA
ncbi:signal recognition particle-docking protein FtsY [Kaistia terrae]|uniref:Signal recognition particle receptor FtsY n=1 Tax=Kaistia terrae TaxID=537017 RepID=A0ABW0PZ47_9HYPH|nr:signal recognition particle-docking protein FtsY [Kaistia terrae]MCX5580850.1 signal recognition particle-docking protein FtsY [Kaistia terrae]